MDTTLDRPAVRTDLPTAVLGAAIRWTAYALFFLMLFVPSTYQPLKGALLGVVLMGIVVSMVLTGRLGLHRPVPGRGAVVAAGLGVFFILKGHLAGEPGALAMFNVYVTWPIVCTILVAGAASRRTLRDLVRLLVVGTNAVACYSIIYVLWEAGYWPDALYYPFDQGQAIGFYGWYIEFGLYSTSTLLFAVPFLFGALLVFPQEGAPVRWGTLWIPWPSTSSRCCSPAAAPSSCSYRWHRPSRWSTHPWLAPATKRQSRRIVRRALWGGLALAVLAIVVIASLGGLAPAGFVATWWRPGSEFNMDPGGDAAAGPVPRPGQPAGRGAAARIGPRRARHRHRSSRRPGPTSPVRSRPLSCRRARHDGLRQRDARIFVSTKIGSRAPAGRRRPA